MIKNDKQRGITSAKKADFVKSLAALDDSQDNDLLKEVMADAIRSQIETFDRELLEYDSLKSSNRSLILTSIDDLPEALIKIRIAKGLSHVDLASRNNLHEQQIQRYEANNYASANFGKLISIFHSMGAQFEKTKVILNQERIPLTDYDSDFIIRATRKLQSRRSLLEA